jgi:hypothetical protein
MTSVVFAQTETQLFSTGRRAARLTIAIEIAGCGCARPAIAS